jgi:hypothetical protein
MGGGSRWHGGTALRGNRVGGAQIAGMGSDRRWHGSTAWRGNNWQGKNWKGRDHDKFDHRFHSRRFVGVGLGWWPAYYGYNYGYGGCAWLRRQALATGSPYWWNRYYACVNYY